MRVKKSSYLCEIEDLSLFLHKALGLVEPEIYATRRERWRGSVIVNVTM